VERERMKNYDDGKKSAKLSIRVGV